MVLSIALAAPIGKRKDVIGRQTLPPRRTENGRGAGAPRRTENGKRRTERAASARRVGRRENGQASKLGQTQRCAAITKNTKNHKDTQSTTQGEPQILENTEDYGEDRGSQSRAKCYRTQDAEGEVWKLGGLEVWTVLTLRGYHKEHEGPQRITKGTARRGGGPCVRARRTSGPGA